MADNDHRKWRRLPKMSFNAKELSKRMRRVEGATVKHAHRFVVKRWSNLWEVRRSIAIWVLALGLLVGATGLQFLWYQQGYRVSANAVGGTYAEAVEGPLNTLNPIFAQSSAEEAVSELLFSRLLTYDSTGHLNYDLAEDMTLSDDQKTYTVRIRPNAQWSDGLSVRARDVVFTVNLLKNPATRSTLQGWDTVTVRAVDDRTVSFELPGVYAAFPHALRYLPILPEHLLRSVEPANLRESSFSTNPTGSGPFAFRLLQDVNVNDGRKVVYLTQNDRYYGGAPKLDRMQLHVYANTDAIARALRTGEVNAASDLPVLSAQGLNASRFVAEYKPINSGVYALFNTSSGVLSDASVRRALRAGTDTAAIREALGGVVPELYLPFITGQITGDVPGAPAYDPTEAGRLLDEAGWRLDGASRSKDGQALTLRVVTTKNPDYEKVLEVLASQWRGLGVAVTTSIVDPNDSSQNVAQEVFQPRRYDVLLYRLTIGGDPDVYAYWHGSQASDGLNFSNYKNSISDDALESARARTEGDLRNAKYLTFARQWLSDAPAVGLYQATAQYVHTPSVHAIPQDDVLVSEADRYNQVLYWTVGERMVFTTP